MKRGCNFNACGHTEEEGFVEGGRVAKSAHARNNLIANKKVLGGIK